MRILYFFLALASFTTFTQGYNTEKMNQGNYGYQTYGKETVNSIQVNGTVVLKGTKVLGLMQVNGSVDADEASMDSIEVNGQAGLKNCLINNQSVINGSLTAENTKFQKELSISSQKITLRTCSVDSLIMRKVNGFDGIQVIELKKKVVLKLLGP